MMKFFLPTAVVMFTMAMPVSADWQWTRWGMSTSDVIAIKGKNVRATTDAESSRK